MSSGPQDTSPSFEIPGYTRDRLLGRGSSADVWLVEEERTGRRFALKCFHPGRENSGGQNGGHSGKQDERPAEEDVRREIRMLSALDHPHLVKAHDVITLPGSDGSILGLLLDYAAGGSLAQLVAARGRLTVGETVTVLTPIGQALAYLHARGFTHADVSPGNVLFSAEGKPLLADVGIARMVGDPAAAARAGTPGFADPAPVDSVRLGLQPERDLYALAAVGWFCLTGETPAATRNRPPLPLIHPEVPSPLAAALESGLQEDRRQRPTAVEFATAVYRSAAPAAVGLSTSVHPSVIPELLTRRRLPDADYTGLRARARSWRRGMARLPVDGGGRQGRRPGDGSSADPWTGVAPSPPPLGHRGRGSGSTRRAAAGLVGLLAACVVGALFWMAGSTMDTAPPVAAPASSTVSMRAEAPASMRAEAPASTPASVGAETVPEDEPPDRIPAGVEAQLGSADPVLAVLGLAWLRSEAFRQGTPELLDQVNVAGSATASADAGTMAALAASGRVLAGFSMELRNIEVSPGGTDAGTAVGVDSSTSSYVEHTKAGEPVTEQPAVAAQRLQVVLVREDGRWQISEILPG